jgi:serine/threonine protein kinase
MMIGPAGVLKLTDFGLAKGPGDARLSQTGAPLGSLWYMSPEQVRGSASDARSDIYSLGAVLYELASGKKPFDGESAFAIMADQVGKPPTPPMEVDPAVPQALNAALLRALEKDPDRRFQTAAEFQQAIVRVQSSANTLQTAPRTSVVRSGVFWVTAALVCLMLSTGGMFASHWLRWPTQAPAAAAVESPDPVANAGKVEPRDTASNQHAKPARQVTRKPAKSGPNIFRKALKPIWPLSKRDRSAADNRQTPHDSTDP